MGGFLPWYDPKDYWGDVWDNAKEGARWFFDEPILKPLADKLQDPTVRRLAESAPGFKGLEALTGLISGAGALAGVGSVAGPTTNVPDWTDIVGKEYSQGLPQAMEVVAPVDLATLGAGVAAKGPIKGLQGLGKLSGGLDKAEALYGVGQTGAGLAKGDLKETGVGLLRSVLGGAGLASEHLNRPINLEPSSMRAESLPSLPNTVSAMAEGGIGPDEFIGSVVGETLHRPRPTFRTVAEHGTAKGKFLDEGKNPQPSPGGAYGAGLYTTEYTGHAPRYGQPWRGDPSIDVDVAPRVAKGDVSAEKPLFLEEPAPRDLRMKAMIELNKARRNGTITPEDADIRKYSILHPDSTANDVMFWAEDMAQNNIPMSERGGYTGDPYSDIIKSAGYDLWRTGKRGEAAKEMVIPDPRRQFKIGDIYDPVKEVAKPVLKDTAGEPPSSLLRSTLEGLKLTKFTPSTLIKSFADQGVVVTPEQLDPLLRELTDQGWLNKKATGTYTLNRYAPANPKARAIRPDATRNVEEALKASVGVGEVVDSSLVPEQSLANPTLRIKDAPPLAEGVKPIDFAKELEADFTREGRREAITRLDYEETHKLDTSKLPPGTKGEINTFRQQTGFQEADQFLDTANLQELSDIFGPKMASEILNARVELPKPIELGDMIEGLSIDLGWKPDPFEGSRSKMVDSGGFGPKTPNIPTPDDLKKVAERTLQSKYGENWQNKMSESERSTFNDLSRGVLPKELQAAIDNLAPPKHSPTPLTAKEKRQLAIAEKQQKLLESADPEIVAVKEALISKPASEMVSSSPKTALPVEPTIRRGTGIIPEEPKGKPSKRPEGYQEKTRWQDSPVVRVFNAAKSLAYGGDVGHLLRQGKQMNVDLLFSKNAKEVLKQFPVLYKSLKSEDFVKKFHERLATDPDIKLATEKFGLDMPGVGKENLKEEVFHEGGLLEETPILGKYYAKPSERVYTTGLNFLRAAEVKKHFEALRKSGFTPEKDPEKFKGVARAINIISQRGDFSKGTARTLSDLGFIFGAPRAKGARVQNLIELFKGGESGATVRKTAAKMIAFNLGLLGLLKASRPEGEIVDDPKRTDFGKFRDGNTTIDLWTGLGTTIRTAIHAGTGKVTSPHSGRDYTVAPADPAIKEVANMVAPGMRAAWILTTGKDLGSYLTGKPPGGYLVDRSEALSQILPLTPKQITEILSQEGGIEKLIYSAMQAGGEGVDIFDYDEARAKQNRLKAERGVSTRATTRKKKSKYNF